MAYAIFQNCEGEKTAEKLPENFANNLGREIYDTEAQCLTAIWFGLNPFDSKEKMRWTENGFMVEFTRQREYRTEFVSSVLADTPEEAKKVVVECWNVRPKAVKEVVPYSFKVDYLLNPPCR